jgi:cardiolipin synthase A/B
VTKYKRFFFLFFCFLCLFHLFKVGYGAVYPELPSGKAPVKFYSNKNHNDLRITLLRALERARNSVYISVFSITDNKIIKALQELSRRGVQITVTYDPSASNKITKFLQHDVNLLPCRPSRGLMHRKIIVIDEAEVWIGSTNLTTESLRLHGNIITGFKSKAAALAVIKGLSHENFKSGTQKMDLWLDPHENDIINSIEKAKKTLRIAMFTWTNKNITDSVVRAHQRGVSVEVVLDRYSGKGASKKALKQLLDNDISASLNKGSELLHYKFAYIDDKELITGSANWTKAAFNNNKESLLIIHDLTTEQIDFMNNLWHNIQNDSSKQNE